MDGGFGDYDYEETQHRHQHEDYSEYRVDSNTNLDSEEIRQSVDPRDSASGKLFVGGVSWETTEDTFTSYFSKYGEVVDSVIMRDKHSGRPRGFGFVTFADSAVADKVLEKDHVIDGRMVEVKRTVPRENMEVKGTSKTRKIFVGGIPPSLTEDQLKEYFDPYGSIVDHQIMLDHTTGRSRGFGFVTFESEDSVEKIFSDGEKHELGGRQVEIKRAEPKRAGGDYSGGGGGGGKSYGDFGNGGGGGFGGRYSGRFSGEMGRGYGGYGAAYGGYGGYGGYGANPAAAAAGFYGGYGGYGFGFVSPMYGGGGGYGGAGYSNPNGYMGTDGYGGGGKGYGSGGGGGGGYGSGKGYGSGGGGGAAGGGGGGSGGGRYHPYRR